MLVAFCSAMVGYLSLVSDAFSVLNFDLFFLKQRRAEISLAEAAHHGDDDFSFVLWTGGDLRGGGHVSAGADSAEDAFFLRQSAGIGKCFFIGDEQNFIDDFQV